MEPRQDDKWHGFWVASYSLTAFSIHLEGIEIYAEQYMMQLQAS